MLATEGGLRVQASPLWSLPWVSMMRGVAIHLQGEGGLILVCVWSGIWGPRSSGLFILQARRSKAAPYVYLSAPYHCRSTACCVVRAGTDLDQALHAEGADVRLWRKHKVRGCVMTWLTSLAMLPGAEKTPLYSY